MWGLSFALPLPFEENKQFNDCKPNLFDNFSFYPNENALYKFCHYTDNWCIEYLSDEIAIEIGKIANFPWDSLTYHSFVSYQIQEVMNIYGGILKTPSINYNLPDSFKMNQWAFFKCFMPKVNSSSGFLHTLKSVEIPVSSHLQTIVDVNEKNILISKMPSTTKILTFDGQHLMTTSFNSLSPSHVYRSSVHNCPVFDTLTADPANGRLFLFQSTLLDPFKHPVSIVAFNKILLNLALTPSLSGFEIYFIMIASAHSNIHSQHFYTFQLSSLYFHSCFLNRYSSLNGLIVLKKCIKGGNVHDKFSSELLSSDEVSNLTSFVKSVCIYSYYIFIHLLIN